MCVLENATNKVAADGPKESSRLVRIAVIRQRFGLVYLGDLLLFCQDMCLP